MGLAPRLGVLVHGMRALRIALVLLFPVGVLAGVVALCIYAGQHPERMRASLTNGDVSDINSRIKSLEDRVAALEAEKVERELRKLLLDADSLKAEAERAEAAKKGR